MTDVRVPLGVALARRGSETRLLQIKVDGIDKQLGSVFGLANQPSAYLIGLQDTLRAEKERLAGEIAKLDAMDGDALRTWYSPKPPEPVSQSAGYDASIDSMLSSSVKPPAGFISGHEYKGPSPA
jgi:hypothetical protein